MSNQEPMNPKNIDHYELAKDVHDGFHSPAARRVISKKKRAAGKKALLDACIEAGLDIYDATPPEELYDE